jgi:hypothetical protein
MGCKILIEAQRGRPEGKPAARVFWILSISEFYQVSYEVFKRFRAFSKSKPSPPTLPPGARVCANVDEIHEDWCRFADKKNCSS